MDYEIQISHPNMTFWQLIISFTWGGTYLLKVIFIISKSPLTNIAPKKPLQYRYVIKSLCIYLMGIWISIFILKKFLCDYVRYWNVVTHKSWVHNLCIVTYPIIKSIYILCCGFSTTYIYPWYSLYWFIYHASILFTHINFYSNNPLWYIKEFWIRFHSTMIYFK